MAMAHGIEGRFPFLDHRLVEFAASLGPQQKLKGLDEKHLLRKAAEGLLPPQIAERRKQPYRAPDSEAFVTPTSPQFVKSALRPDNVKRFGLFDPAAVERLHRKCEANKATGFRDNTAFIGVLSTQLWQETFATSSENRAVA
jgi:asparagine synthase (glutamine-hydrolysing)